MKPAIERSYELETILGDLRRRLARHAFDGVRLSASDVQALCEQLEDCRAEAVAMRCELSRKRWNAVENTGATADPLIEVVLAESRKPDTNLVFFPVVCRPIPGDAVQLGRDR